MIKIPLLRKIAVLIFFAAFLVNSIHVCAQAPSISVPSPVTFTQGIVNAPVVITNTGGAIPNKVYGQPVVVPTEGLPANLNLLAKAADGSLYVGVLGDGPYAVTAIYKITPDGTASLYAGSNTPGYVDGSAASSRFMNIISLAADALGNLYLTEVNTVDAENSRVRKISSDGTVSTFASGLRAPKGIAIDAAGAIYVIESSWIRKYSPSGTYTIFAGKIGPGHENGQGTDASFTNPTHLVFDQEGNLYVGESLYTVCKITPSGMVSRPYFSFPVGKSMVIDATGTFYVSTDGGAILKVSPGVSSLILLGYGAGNLVLSDGELYFFYAGQLQRMPIFGYGVEPPLPRGVTLNGNGSISGTPEWINDTPWDYTVTAYNTSGSSSATLKYNAVMQAVAPTITSFTPTAAVRNSTITIEGTHFLGATEVSIGGIPVQSFSVFGFNTIYAVMAPGTLSGEVKVTNPYGSGTLGGFTVIPPPVITSFSPASAMKGEVVTIMGENFSDIRFVMIGNKEADSYKVVSPTMIEAVVGNGSSGNITVHGAAGTSSKEGFEFIAPPFISTFTISGGLGSEILISGTSFLGATSVKFGGTEASSFTVVSSTSIKAILGSGSTGDVSITTPAGIASKSGFTWVAPPVITSFSPTSSKQGAYVTIVGSNFQNATSVLFGGVPAASFYASPNSISAKVDVGASGDITVVAPGGTGTKSGFVFLPPPQITSFTPSSAHRGDIVTITGTNFKSDASVAFGGFLAEDITVLSSTTIEAKVGYGASGSIMVTDAGGSSSVNGFNHTGPAISSFTPLSGGTGTLVTINGQNFTNITKVTFGGIPAASFTVKSPTTITAVVGTGQSGSVTVLGDYGVSFGNATFQHAGPSIGYLNTYYGYAGSTFVISGVNFTGVTSVSFGGVPAASFTVVNDSRIDAILANTGASGDVVVESPKGTSLRSGFIYLLPPTISSFSPTIAGYNQKIIITGTSFQNVSSVKIGGTQVYPVSYSTTSLEVLVPEIPVSGNISITTPAGVAVGETFTHTGPKILSFTPVEAPVGYAVTIIGENLRGIEEVNFGTVPSSSITVISDTEIKATVPPNAGATIQLKKAEGRSFLSGFLLLNSPFIWYFTPEQAGAGVPVTISGNNFSQVSSVSFGGVPAESFVVDSPNKITAIPGSGASGSIEVTTIAGIGSRTGFAWFAKPIISSFSPKTAAAGSTVTITGSNLSGVSTVKFGSKYANGFKSISSTSISVTVGEGESGDISLSTPAGTATIAGFTFIPPPSISSFTVKGGGAGATVTIIGTDFTDVSSVKFGEFEATSFTVKSATEITAIVGLGETGIIRVTTPGGTAKMAGFFYQKIPLITSFWPESGPVGTTLTITGANFNPNASDNKVYFGSIRATVMSATSTELQVTVPAEVSNTPIRVLNAGNKLSGFSTKKFRVTYKSPSPSPVSLFTQQTELEFQYPISGVNIADFDGDGKNDLIVFENSGFSNHSGLLIIRNSLSAGLSSVSFSEILRLPVKSVTAYGIGDVNGDGLEDIVCISGSKIIVLENTSSPGDISFTADTVQNINFWSFEDNLVIRDVDLDGKCDIEVAGRFYRNTSSFLPGSTISFGPAEEIYFSGGGSYSNPVLEDMNGDGKLDLMMSSSYRHISIAQNNSTPGDLNKDSFSKQISMSTLGAKALYAVDLDGDDKPEIMEADYNFLAIRHNKHSSGPLDKFSFGSPILYNFSMGGEVCTFGDLDGDTKPDILYILGSTVKMLKNLSTSGSFNWEEKTLFNAGAYPGSVWLSSKAIGDLDGDGKPEIVLTNSTNYKIIILHTNPANGPSISSFTPASGGPGTTVTITGHNFLGTTAVTFGERAAASFKVVSSNTIIAVVGSGATGSITVSNPVNSTSKGEFIYFSTNFKVQVTSATCKASNNGSVMISTQQEADYTATIKGNNREASYTFRSSKEITGLAAGSYEVCIAVAGQPDFNRCFTVMVTEPKELAVFSYVDNSRNTLNLQMDGGSLFNIELNGKTYQTSSTEMELPLKPGANILSVWTDKDCQGKILRIIEMASGHAVYPNPFESNIFVVAKQSSAATIEVHGLDGKRLYSMLHENVNGLYTVNLQHLAPGIYLLQVRSEANVNTYKIIKR